MNNELHTDHFARKDEGGSPSEIGDLAAVHGLLALLLPGETAAVQARVDRAIATIRRENMVFGRFVRRPAAWVGGSIGIAAAIVIAVLFLPASSDSRAYAALESIRAHSRDGIRTYQVRVQSEKPDGPQRGGPRQAELVLGPGGVWTLGFMMPHGPQLDQAGDSQLPPLPPPRPARPRITLGFDGTRYWFIRPDGEIVTAKSLRELGAPMMTGAFSALAQDQRDSEGDPEPMMLDSILDKLDRGYTTSFGEVLPEDEVEGRATTVVTLKRQKGPEQWRGPRFVRVVADSETSEVLRANWEWVEPQSRDSGPPTPPAVRRISVRLIDRETPSGRAALEIEGWFSPGTHAKRGFPRDSKPFQPNR